MSLCYLVILSLPSFSATVEETIKVTVGNSFIISPWSDVKSDFDWYTCASTGVSTSSPNAFSINVNSTTKTRYPSYNGGYNDGFYSTYKVEALEVGTFIINGRVSCYRYSGNTLTVGNPTVVYHVIVSEVPKVTSINIPNSLELYIDETYTISPVIQESGASTTLTWNSSNPSVAKVNNGVVTGLNAGTSVITCTASNGVSAQCLVTVHPNRAILISLNESEGQIEINQTMQLEAYVLPENVTNGDVKWSSSDENIAIVSTTGLVVGVSEGWANITATTTDGSNLSASCLVHVVAPKILATSLTLDAANLELTQGDNATLTATLQPANVSSSELAWTSSDENVVKVNATGEITAVSIGNAVVKASTTDGSNLSAICNVRVKSKSIADFDNVVYFNDATVLKNSESVLALQLKNSMEITAIQFDLALPEGVSIAKNVNGTAYAITFEEERADVTTHALNSALQEDGTVRVLCYSTASEVFLGNEGTILYFPISVADLPRGAYNIILKNIVITDTKGDKTNIDVMGSVLNVVEAVPGDANGDSEIDVADIVVVANHILGSNAEGFLAEAADFDSDGTVDVADIVNIANHILGGGNTAAARTLARAVLSTRTAEAGYSLEVLPFVLDLEESKTVTLDLINPGMEFTAFQCDIYLPEGLTVDKNRRGKYNFTFNTENDRTDANYHTLSGALQSDGAIRVLCYSTMSEVFWGEDGALVDIPLTADASLACGVYEFTIANTVLTYVNGEKVEPETYKGSIVVGDGGEVKEVKLHGKYTADVVEGYSTVLAANSGITSVDLTEAVSVDSESTLTTGNPNTVVYLAEGMSLANTCNVVSGDECSSLVLTDGYAFDAPVAFTAAQASYTRELASGKYGTIVLPFAPNVEEYVFYALTEAGDNSLTFDEVAQPEANTPYLYTLRDDRAATAITASNVQIETASAVLEADDWSMVGAYAGEVIDCASTTDTYYYAYSSANHELNRVTKTLTVKPYRAYLTSSSAVSKVKVRTRGGETVIDAAEIDNDAPVYYDLSGRRVAQPTKGVYIVNGKKIVL